MFYDLFRKYRQTYRVEEILAGNANAETMAQAQRAPFDERLSLISLLLETLQGDIAKLDQREEAITQVSALLKNKKEAFAHGSAQEDAEALKDISQQLQEDTRRKKKAGALAVRQERAIRTTLQLLEEMRLSISEHPDTPPASQMEEVFSSEADAVAQDAEGIRTRMEHMLDFCERAFGEGQEMLILVTELSVHALSAQFIARYGCDAYYRHNQSLLLYDRRNDLLNDIAALNLDDRAD